jgi:hypothetical protein
MKRWLLSEKNRYVLRILLVAIQLLLAYWMADRGSHFFYQGF